MTVQLTQTGEPLPWQIATTNYESVTNLRTKEKPMPLNEMQGLALNAYIELLRLKNYSPNTISNYRNWFILFMNSFPDRKPSTITKNEIMDMLVRFRKSDKWSATSQNQFTP